MQNLRKYGKPPFEVVVIHGGPGAPGEMAPVARALATGYGVLEPLQTALSLEGQVEELVKVLKMHGKLPLILIGHSWGAWLGFIVAARDPVMVRQLILIGSGPFEEKYAGEIMSTRFRRLNGSDRAELVSLVDKMNDRSINNKNTLMARFGKLMTKADSYDLIPHDDEVLEYQFEVNRRVWAEAETLRRTGELLNLGRKIHCPVVAIHGDHDPHPSEGVKAPLAAVLRDFRFIPVKNCGHYPWLERHAREEFFTACRSCIDQELDH